MHLLNQMSTILYDPFHSDPNWELYLIQKQSDKYSRDFSEEVSKAYVVARKTMNEMAVHQEKLVEEIERVSMEYEDILSRPNGSFLVSSTGIQTDDIPTTVTSTASQTDDIVPQVISVGSKRKLPVGYYDRIFRENVWTDPLYILSADIARLKEENHVLRVQQELLQSRVSPDLFAAARSSAGKTVRRRATKTTK